MSLEKEVGLKKKFCEEYQISFKIISTPDKNGLSEKVYINCKQNEIPLLEFERKYLEWKSLRKYFRLD
ncbi:MAG: hypothetical protein KJ566_03145 [Nanoarchaeota archaeon]|nr:hypothetical protein [Nanoarchaeota archaeon]